MFKARPTARSHSNPLRVYTQLHNQHANAIQPNFIPLPIPIPSQVKPGRAISIYGNLDLEVDFAPVKGSPEGGWSVLTETETGCVLGCGVALVIM